jgi:hypothetical protein
MGTPFAPARKGSVPGQKKPNAANIRFMQSIHMLREHCATERKKSAQRGAKTPFGIAQRQNREFLVFSGVLCYTG